jgi:hypothetical protein
MQDINSNFGTEVHALKQKHGNQQLGAHVSAATHEKNEAKKVDKLYAMMIYARLYDLALWKLEKLTLLRLMRGF